MSRLRYDNALGTLGASLSPTGTTITFLSAPAFATLTGSDYIVLALEPASNAPSANFEIVYLTAFTSGATTGTITRGQEGTSGASHALGLSWACVPTATDLNGLLPFGSTAPGTGHTGDLFIVRSDGTVGRVTPTRVLAAAWGCSPSASYTANTTAINSAITAAAAYQTIFGVGAAAVELPVGLISTSGGHTDGGASVLLIGAGENRTYLQVNAAATAGVDVVTLSGKASLLMDVTIDGNRVNVASGDCLVLNGPYTGAERCGLFNAGGNAITLGKAAAVAGARLGNLRIRTALGYGIQTVAASSTFDGLWHDIDIGQCGKSGVRLDSGSQNLTNVHSWGNGIYSDNTGTDSAGFYVNSDGNQFADCESETNNSYGYYDRGKGNTWAGGRIWGNYLNGVNIGTGSSRGAMVGAGISRNGVANTAGSSSSAYAGVQNSTQFFTMTGCSIWDDGTAVVAGSYSGFTPTFPFPGRSAIFTQAKNYHEVTGADYSTIVGNTMRQEDTRSGISYVLVGTHSVFRNNDLGAGTQQVPAVASAGTITIPADAKDSLCQVTGSTQITAITACAPGTRVTLMFTAAAPAGVAHNGTTVNLANGINFTCGQNGSVELVCDGTNWWQEAVQPQQADPPTYYRNGAKPYRESVPRQLVAQAITPATGVMLLTAIPMFAGDVITSLGFRASAGATFGTNLDGHLWVALYDTTLTRIAQGPDQAAASAFASGWLATAAQALTGGPYTISKDGLYYAAIMVAIGTGGTPVMPTLAGISGSSNVFAGGNGNQPSGQKTLAATNGSALTTTAPAGPIVLTGSGNLAYAVAY